MMPIYRWILALGLRLCLYSEIFQKTQKQSAVCCRQQFWCRTVGRKVGAPARRFRSRWQRPPNSQPPDPTRSAQFTLGGRNRPRSRTTLRDPEIHPVINSTGAPISQRPPYLCLFHLGLEIPPIERGSKNPSENLCYSRAAFDLPGSTKRVLPCISSV